MNNRNRSVSLICLILIVVVGVDCKFLKFSSGGGGVNESAAPVDTVKAAYKTVQDARFYQATSTSTNSLGTIVTTTVYNAPDRFWTKNAGTNFIGEVIVAGDDSYSRANGGKWTKVTSGQALKASDMKPYDLFAASVSNVESAGKETMNGKDSLIYKFNSSYGGEAIAKMWVEKSSGLPLRVESVGSYTGTSVAITMTYDFEHETKVETPDVE